MPKKASSAAGPKAAPLRPGLAAATAPQATVADWLQRFQAASALHLQGQLQEARAAYLKLVVLAPANVHLLKLLGMLEKDLGQWALAARWLELALSVQADTDALLQLAEVRQQQGDASAARQCLDAAVALQPDSAKAWYQLGRVCKTAGDSAAALAAFAKVLALEPGHAQALSQQAYVQLKLGQFDAAIDSYSRYLQDHGSDAVAHYNLGMALQSAQRPAEAVLAYRQAIAADPHMDSAWNNLGSALAQLHDHAGALQAHDTSLQLAPDNANYHNNRGTALHACGRFDEAAQAFAQALALQPDLAAAAFNRGNALREALRLPEAIASLDQALALQPGNANFHWTKALAALLHGDYRLGWLHYELRWSRDGGETRRVFAVPQWTGRQAIQGKTLLIHCEQGLGDMIQFARYALDVVALGGTVVCGMPPVLHPLLRSMHPSIQCITSNAEHPGFDFHCPVMSLPYAFSTTLETVPAPCPYVFADPPLQQEWARRLGPARGPRVGLVWFGNPKHPHDHRRSIPLEALQPVLELPLDLHSLQQEVRAQDQAALAKQPGMHFHGPALTDLAQTAALVANLDLVVTVDTAVAHLAAALGKPVWILVHAVPDFRWLLGRDDSPWYPSVRLFRQARHGVWDQAILDLRAALVQRFGL